MKMTSRSFVLILASLVHVAWGDAGKPPSGLALADYGSKEYLRLSRSLPHVQDTPWRLVCTMPYNCQFQPSLEVEAEAGQVIQFNSTNALVLYLTKTESVTTEAGIHTYEAKKWVSGEGALYTIPAGVKVRSVSYRETGYDTSFAGSFHCNDEDYNVLWKKGARTAYLCMRERFYDCPDRERVGFWGDGTPELGQCFYAFDPKSHRLCKELVLRKLEPKFYPGQHLEFLGDYGLWFYYLQTGDLESIRTVYEPTKKFLFETYQFGNKRTWFDWGKEIKDTAVTETCFYYNCLGTLRKMALATGHEDDVPAIDQKLEGIRSTFDATYWKENAYQSSQVTTPDDRANAMAVNCGLADPSKWEAIYQNVLSHKTYASCFFDRWVFEALCKMGRQEHALVRMADRYRTMIPARFTTLWEHYDRWWASRIDAYDDASSLNHGWNPPVLILSQSIAGVSPETPGWGTYHVLPKEAFLKEIQVVVPSVKGGVRVGIRKDATTYALTVDSPPGTTAVLGIPKGSFTKLDSIQARGVTVWDGAFRGGPKGITWNGEDSDYVKFNVTPGAWELVGRGTLPVSTPKVPAQPAAVARPLDSRTWTASACVSDAPFPFSGAKIPIDASAANMLDGDPWTGWRDMTGKQHPGQWVQVDMQKEQVFSKVTLDNTWALWDFPVGFAVSVSKDGKTWSDPIASGAGNLGVTTISFPRQTARHLRITQTGSSPTYHWSVFELDVFGDQ